MIERKRVVAKVVELMDQINELQLEGFTRVKQHGPMTISELQTHQNAVFAKALVVDHLMWVLDLGDPKLPGAFLVREEHEKNGGT